MEEFQKVELNDCHEFSLSVLTPSCLDSSPARFLPVPSASFSSAVYLFGFYSSICPRILFQDLEAPCSDLLVPSLIIIETLYTSSYTLPILMYFKILLFWNFIIELLPRYLLPVSLNTVPWGQVNFLNFFIAMEEIIARSGLEQIFIISQFPWVRILGRDYLRSLIKVSTRLKSRYQFGLWSLREAQINILS